MKVVIFCGGIGTRLKEETEFKPKPMVKIGNKPILWHIMKTFSHYGYKDFVLCLGYKGDMIREYFYNYELLNSDVTIELGCKDRIDIHRGHEEVGWKITLVDTGEKTLKGGRLKLIEKYVDSDEFFLTYGDGLANVNIKSLLEFHQKHKKMATVTGINPASRFGELVVSGDSVTAFNEKPEKSSGLINGGYMVLNKKVFNYVTCDEQCDFEVGAMEKIAHEGQLMVYKHEKSWACMDNIRDMDYLNKLWNENKAFWKVWN